jgi:hypothetical protein
MTAPVDLPLADTSDMIGLHRVFREALAAAPALVGGASQDDADRVELVASYYANVLDLLHSHHEGEDELLTPRLLARVPAQAERIARIGGQHETVLAAVDTAEAAIASWRADPSAAEWGELPAHGMRSFRGDKMWLIIGLIQEQMSPPHRADMEAHMPPPMLEFWRSDGQRMFDSYVAELRR